MLRRAGLRASDQAITQARQHDEMTPDDLIGLAEFYAMHQAAWASPGAILHAIRQWTPGDPPDDWSLWPTPNREYTGDLRRSTEHRERQTQAVVDAEAVENDRRELEALEADFGEQLDVLVTDVAQLAALLEQTPKLANPFFRERLRRSGIDSTMRGLLLRTLADRRKPKPR